MDHILKALDDQITHLQSVRSKYLNIVTIKRTQKAVKPAKKTRTLSPEARKRIADAQRARWAKKKKAAK